MPGVACGQAMHGRQFLDVAIVLYSRSSWPDDLVTCDVTRGGYLMMIIDYSILLVSIVMVDYSGTFLFVLFLFFSFLFWQCRACAACKVDQLKCKECAIKTQRNLVVWTVVLKTTFNVNLTRHSSLHGIFIPRQFQIRFLSERCSANTLFCFIHINRSYIFQI